MSLKRYARDLLELGNQYLNVLKFPECTDTAKESEESVADRELVSQVVYNAIEVYRREEISKGRLLDIGKRLFIPEDLLVELAQAAV